MKIICPEGRGESPLSSGLFSFAGQERNGYKKNGLEFMDLKPSFCTVEKIMPTVFTEDNTIEQMVISAIKNNGWKYIPAEDAHVR